MPARLTLAIATASLTLLAPIAETRAQTQAPLLAEACLGCHGPGGSGASGVPALAGREAAELRAALVAFRANERPGTIMGRITRGYTEAELAALAEHFAKGASR